MPFPAALLESGAGRVWSPWFSYWKLLPADALFPAPVPGASWPGSLVTAAPPCCALLSRRSWVPGHRGHSICLVPRMTMYFNVQTIKHFRESNGAGLRMTPGKQKSTGTFPGKPGYAIFPPVLSLLAQFLCPSPQTPHQFPRAHDLCDFACQELLDLGLLRFGLHHRSLRDLPLWKAQRRETWE